GARPGVRDVVGLVVGFAGAALLVRGPVDAPEGSLAGALALLAATVFWSIGSLEVRRLHPTPDALLTCAMQMLVGGGGLVLLGGVRGEWSQAAAQTVSMRSVGAFVYLVVIGALLGFTTYAWLIRIAPPTAVSTYAYVNPLVAVLLGWLLGGEALERRVLIA